MVAKEGNRRLLDRKIEIKELNIEAEPPIPRKGATILRLVGKVNRRSTLTLHTVPKLDIAGMRCPYPYDWVSRLEISLSRSEGLTNEYYY